MQEALFRQALGLTQPWDVERVSLDVARSRIDLYVVWRANSAPCPACGASEQRIHDHRQRSWRHLDFFQFVALALTLAGEMPVLACTRILRCSGNALWRQIDAHVKRARAEENYAETEVIGIDETSCSKGHSCITLVQGLSNGKLIYATPGGGGG